MDKLLVHLKVPGILEGYDLLVPPDLEIGELISNLISGLKELDGDAFSTEGSALLATREPDLLLDPAKTLRDYSIHDGSVLVLL